MKTTTTSNPGAMAPITQRTADDTPRPLPRLIEWLYRTAAQRGEMKSEMARKLGVTYGYVNQLATGVRAVENITAEFARSCARYLDIPPVAVMLASGRLRMEDMLVPRQDRPLASQLNEGLQRIAADPLVGALMPDEVWDVPDTVKMLLVALYEDATKRELFPPQHLPLLLQGLQDAALVIDELDAANDATMTADYLRGEGGPDA